MYFFLSPMAGMVGFAGRQPSSASSSRTWADAVPTGSDQMGETMPAFLCSTCGTEYPPSEAPPALCPVCEDERQFIPPEGQSWTTLERLRISHHNGFRQYEPGLIGIGTQPKFAIGQRALLLCTPEGNSCGIASR